MQDMLIDQWKTAKNRHRMATKNKNREEVVLDQDGTPKDDILNFDRD